ncbi:MAG TPA: BamA/TamA family outer membrane protein [Chryseolinea sp.]
MKSPYTTVMLICFFFIVVRGQSQSKKFDMGVFRDSLDEALDLSAFLINMHGFVPVPVIVTEPALGGFGLGVAPIFLKKRPPVIDTLATRVKVTPTAPDMTGGAAAYTLNKTWGVFAFQSGTWLKARSKYRIAGGYANVNISFYRTLNNTEQQFRFNMRVVPFMAYLLKGIRGTNWSAGMQYMMLHTKLKTDSESLPAFVSDKEVTSIVSMPSAVVEYDNRDNILTPDKGLRWRTSVGWSDNAVGSDYDYVKLSSYVNYYYPVLKNLIGGFRWEMQEVFNDPPFYLLPFIDLRGIPIARYQGNIFSLVETEWRWDFVRRWSVVGFVGTGKAYDTWSAFGDADWETSGGAGFRYLIARKFRLRCGVDLARGPEQWAYYIVFGSSWFR